MKSVFSFILALTITATAFAEAPATLAVVTSAKSIFKVYYNGAETGKVKVSIYSNSEKLIFSEVINNVSSFVRPYNFRQLNEGEYTIVVEDKNGKQVQKVNYVMPKIISTVKVTEVANAESKYLLNIANNGTEEVHIRIFDNTKGMVYQQTVTVTNNYSLLFNLSKVRSSKDAIVMFEVTTGNGKTETVVF